MPSLSQYSATNIENSVASWLGTKVLAAGYLVYWHTQDGLDTPDGFYPEYSANQDATLANAAVAARVAAAKGLLTIRGPLTAVPQFVTRPTSSGEVDSQNEIPVPALAVEVGGQAPTDAYEVGSRLKWRSRRLTIQGFMRTRAEMRAFEDWLAEWFDEDTEVDILDHDSGSLANLGSCRVVNPAVDGDLQVADAEPATYGVELNARLEYVA